MKNKKTYYIIAIVVIACCLLGNSLLPSYASSKATVLLKASQTVLPKDGTITIQVTLQDSKTAAFHANLYFDDTKVELIEEPENSHVIGNRIIFIWHDETGGKESRQGEIATFEFRAKEEGLANFVVEGEFYNPAGQQMQVDFQQTAVQIGQEQTILEKQVEEEQGSNQQKDNPNLQALRINQEGLVPNFDPNISNYYLTVLNSVEDLEIIPITENPQASVQITKDNKLKEGLNRIEITVTSEDGSKTKQYVLEVTKTENLALANTNLETLAIEHALLNPPFDPAVTHYQTEVSNTVSDLKLLAIPEYEKATVMVEGKEGLQDGNNTITILVTAANGFTKKQYEVIVYKRNEEEEKQEEKRQKENQEKLDQAYEIEKTMAKEETTPEDKNLSLVGIIVTSLFVLGIGVLGYALYKKDVFHLRKKNRK